MKPFKITYKRRFGDQKEVTIYACSYDEAIHNFYLSRPLGCSNIISCELDVGRAEKDVALHVAHQAKQRHGGNTNEAAREVQKTLKACRIQIVDVMEELQKCNLPI